MCHSFVIDETVFSNWTCVSIYAVGPVVVASNLNVSDKQQVFEYINKKISFRLEFLNVMVQ
jgi:hypothetical protein